MNLFILIFLISVTAGVPGKISRSQWICRHLQNKYDDQKLSRNLSRSGIILYQVIQSKNDEQISVKTDVTSCHDDLFMT